MKFFLTENPTDFLAKVEAVTFFIMVTLGVFLLHRSYNREEREPQPQKAKAPKRKGK